MRSNLEINIMIMDETVPSAETTTPKSYYFSWPDCVIIDRSTGEVVEVLPR